MEQTENDFFIAAKDVNKVKKIISENNYKLEFDDKNNINGITYTGDRLDEKTFLFEKIAPLVKSGSCIHYTDSEGCHWKWVFKNGKCFKYKAKTIWMDETYQNNNITRIDIGFAYLTVEENDCDSQTPEIFVSLEDKTTGGVFQDIAMVKPMLKKEGVECLVWSDCYSEDSTHKFEINAYKDY